MPPLLAAYDALPAGDSLKTKLAEQVAQLRSWDYRFAANSVPMALANAYGEEVSQAAAAPARASGTLTLGS